MRVTIAFIAVLIVGSDAGLLDGLLNPVISILNPSPAVTRANTCLASLHSQVQTCHDVAVIDLRAQLKLVTDRISVFQNGALVIAQGLVVKGASGAAGLVANLQSVIQSVLVIVQNLLGGVLAILFGAPVKTDLFSQIDQIFVNFNLQIDNNCKPSIQTLNVNIGNGRVNSQCFFNDVSRIEGNTTIIVQEVTQALDNLICRIIQRVEDILASIDVRVLGLNTSITACGADLDCQVRLVSFRLR